MYPGRVVNITKFGAFVNILPGRDGLLHISKIGGGKRIDRVEDVFNLGDEVEVKVDDVDPNGKVSPQPGLAPIDIPDSAVSSGGGGRGPRPRSPRPVRHAAMRRRPRPAAPRSCPSRTASTPRSRQEFGDLGPAATEGGGRGGERRGGDRGRRGGGRR